MTINKYRNVHHAEDVDECAEGNRCDPNAACTNTIGSFFCTCESGFTGDGFACGK